jgi:hypothetical protein
MHSLLSLSRVINDEICFYEKADFQVYELFRTRYSLFKQVSRRTMSFDTARYLTQT